MSQQGKWFKQRYHRNIIPLSTCRPVLLSGNVLSENVAAGERVQTTIYRKINNLSLWRPLLLSGSVQSEHVAAGESVQPTILSEH